MKQDKDNDTARAFAPHIFCRVCSSPLVQASDWRPEEETVWYVRLWCPECGFEQAAILDRPQSTYLSLAIEEGFAQMLEALGQISSARPTYSGADLVRMAQTERIEPAG
ncbi:MAG: hypothetical protein LLG45_12745 [Actinomycetia bacterium]|nr:hypothetical protein [Actinomycetes bacterium]